MLSLSLSHTVSMAIQRDWEWDEDGRIEAAYNLAPPASGDTIASVISRLGVRLPLLKQMKAQYNKAALVVMRARRLGGENELSTKYLKILTKHSTYEGLIESKIKEDLTAFEKLGGNPAVINTSTLNQVMSNSFSYLSKHERDPEVVAQSFWQCDVPQNIAMKKEESDKKQEE